MKALAALLLCALLAGCAHRPSVSIKRGYDFTRLRRVAVLGFDDFPRRPGSGAVVGSLFEKRLLEAGYDVIERRQAGKLLKEQAFGVSGAVDPRTAKALGKMLGADALVLGGISSFSEPVRRMVMANLEENRQEPVTARVVRRKKVGEEWVDVEEEQVTGYRNVRTVRQVPQSYMNPAEVGIAVRMVDASTGEILWIGSYTEEAESIGSAAEGAARRIMDDAKATWPSKRP